MNLRGEFLPSGKACAYIGMEEPTFLLSGSRELEEQTDDWYPITITPGVFSSTFLALSYLSMP